MTESGPVVASEIAATAEASGAAGEALTPTPRAECFRPWRSRDDGWSAYVQLRPSPHGGGYAIDLTYDVREGCRQRRLAVYADYAEALAAFDRWHAHLDCRGRDDGCNSYFIDDPDERAIDARRQAAYLWRARRRVEGTPAETYLRDLCGLTRPIPECFAFLPGQGAAPDALIAVYGWVEEGVRALYIAPIERRGYGTIGGAFSIGDARGPVILRNFEFDRPQALVIAHTLESGLAYYTHTDAAVVVTGDPLNLSRCETLASYAAEIAIEPVHGPAFGNALRRFAWSVRRDREVKPYVRVIIN